MSVLSKHEVHSQLIPSPRYYRVLMPDGAHEDLPLLLLLHGGGSDSEYLHEVQPLFDHAWDNGLPPMAVAMVDAARSFYLDFADGSQKWESYIFSEWLPELRENFPVGKTSEQTLIAGISMGGYGTLRIALHHPEAFAAMAAMEPAVMPAYTLAEVNPDNISFQSREVLEQRFGNPPDEYWNASNPASIIRDNADAIRDSGVSIYLEVGTDDFLRLNEGTEFLHQVLLEHNIRHEYRLVLGGNHVGHNVGDRFLNMLDFLERTLKPPLEDPVLAEILKRVQRMRG